MSGPPYDPARLRQIAGEIVTAARELAAWGWTPATSSNFSMRLDEQHAAITVSGLDKGRLTEDGVMVVDLDGWPVATEQRPSAETVLHTRLYQRDPGIGQDMPATAGQVEALFDAGPLSGYLIAGHGLYAWGRDLAEARRHLEAFEFMLACELELRKLT
jgi:methylthioribulose-1-phosphate dehydratase